MPQYPGVFDKIQMYHQILNKLQKDKTQTLSRVQFQQIEVGDHAVFAYLIGDLDTGDAAVVDPADDVDQLIGLAREHRLEIRTIRGAERMKHKARRGFVHR